VASVAKPDTILAWYRKLIAHKFDDSQYRRYPGRPRIEPVCSQVVACKLVEKAGCSPCSQSEGRLHYIACLSSITLDREQREDGDIKPDQQLSDSTQWELSVEQEELHLERHAF